MSTSNPQNPENRVQFDGPHETAVNDMYHLMRETNATFDAMITYLKTTNTKLASGTGNPGALTEAILKTVKKLSDENKEVADKWAAYMALRGGVISHKDVVAPVDDYESLGFLLSKIKNIYKDQYNKISQNVYPAANGGAGAAFADPHLMQFVQVNILYNQKKLYQVTKAMQINSTTTSALGDYIFSNALDLNDERDIFDFSNVM